MKFYTVRIHAGHSGSGTVRSRDKSFTIVPRTEHERYEKKASGFKRTKKTNNQTIKQLRRLAEFCSGFLLQRLMKDVLNSENTKQQGTFKFFFAVGKETKKQTKNYVNDSATLESLRILLLATFTDVTSIIST